MREPSQGVPRLVWYGCLRGVQRLPLTIRQYIFSDSNFLSRMACWFWCWLVPADSMVIVPLNGPLAGDRMRLSWQGHQGYYLGLHERSVVRAITQHVRPGWTCIDVGAHIGYVTLVLSRCVGPRGKVIAFEPVPENVRVLRENLALNHVENVVVEPRALGRQAGTVTLRCRLGEPLSPRASASGYDVPGEFEELVVPQLSLDEYMAAMRGQVDCVKIDVEEMELDVLEGMQRVLEDHAPILLVELHRFGQLGEKHPVLSWLRDTAGYQVEFLGSWGQEAHILAVPSSRWPR